MADTYSAAARDEVARLARDLNAAWLDNRLADLRSFFHEQVIAAPPGSAARFAGREAMVDSYAQFMAAAKILDFKSLNLRVELFGSTAVSELHFFIRYEMEGTVIAEEGLDTMVWNREGGAWRAVWRTQSSLPATQEDNT